MSTMTLFDIPTPASHVKKCHDCGNELTELEAILPATCLQSLACTGCCIRCHHGALERIMTAPNGKALLEASYRGFKEARRR